jgi:hypothetical protein
MIIETEIRVGDIVGLSPNKMSTLDDLDLEVGTVLEIDEEESQYKVVFNNDPSINEAFFDNDSVVDWFSRKHVINVERDYKVIDIADSQDTITGQEVCIITMARLKKQVEQTDEGYHITASADEFDTDKFIFAGFTANELSELQDTYSRISFAQYKLMDACIDAVSVKSYKPKILISEPGDIFVMLDLGYSHAD